MLFQFWLRNRPMTCSDQRCSSNGLARRGGIEHFPAAAQSRQYHQPAKIFGCAQICLPVLGEVQNARNHARFGRPRQQGSVFVLRITRRGLFLGEYEKDF